MVMFLLMRISDKVVFPSLKPPLGIVLEHQQYRLLRFFLRGLKLSDREAMAFKLPTKRRRRSSIDTPPVTSSSWHRSSSVARSSPMQPSGRNTEQRVSLVPRDYREGSTARSVRAASVLRSDIEDASERHADADGNGEDDSNQEVVMAVDMRDRGIIGCCYYAAAKETLYLMADIKAAGLEVIDLRTWTNLCNEEMLFISWP